METFKELHKKYENQNGKAEIQCEIDFKDKPILSENLKPLVLRALHDIETIDLITNPDHDDYLVIRPSETTTIDQKTTFEDRVFEIRIFQTGLLTGAVEFYADQLDESIIFTGDIQ